MYKIKLKFFIILFSILFIVFISTLLIFESLEINQLKDISLKNFISLKNNLFLSENPISPEKRIDYLSTIPKLTAFRIKNNTDTTIYFFSKSGLQKQNDIEAFYEENKSIYKVIYNHNLRLSNDFYLIEAAFEVLTQKDLFSILVKLSVIIFVYLFFIIIFFILNYKVKTDYNLSEKIIDNHPDKKITDELKKSASFDQDIVLTFVGCHDNNILENETEFYVVLKKQFPFHDLIFKYDDNVFGILLPNMDLEKGIQEIEKFDQTFVSSSSTSLKFPIMFGLSSRNGRLISGNIILKEAKAALNKAMSDKDFPIIGFRPNPARYREYLSKLKPKK